MYDKIADTEGHILDWGQPGFKEEGLEQWIQFRLLIGKGKYQRQIGNSLLGELVRIFLNFNLFEKFPFTKNMYSFTNLRKNILEYVYQKFVPVFDYSVSNAPLVGEVKIQEILNDSLVDSGEVNGVRQWNINFLGRFLSSFSLS